VSLKPLTIAELMAGAGAALCAFVPLSPAVVEYSYSTGFYPHVQHALTPVANQIPFAILDVLLVSATIAVLVTIVRAARTARRRRSVFPVFRALGHIGGVAAVLYMAFLLLWGFNYRRIEMPDRLVLERAAPTSEDVVRLGLTAVDSMNRLYPTAHNDSAPGAEWKDESLVQPFHEVLQSLSDGPVATPGRLKHSLLGPYFRWTGVDGMINPFGLEVIANPDLLPFERPFVASHEWGHLAGFADESEANFVGWLTCVRASPAAQYSGWFYLYWQISGEVGDAERRTLNAKLEQGPRNDINAVIARLRRGEVPALQRASWSAYDQYLKANRVEAGIRSYGAVVNLILRARFQNGWTPVRVTAEQSALPKPAEGGH
jgi:hypothetical protein